ncbi:hypothetical protein RFI_26234 [Reticulomyxa filosa]|uniref:Uncharacterized protein n=1 Tax=Reticulomyxa filosa TaxID=46433 RepID=X6MBT5_RETFI|nr:hypothetical protein RFI_26234 [Reticulomyxa filosa]|eukprot:ETO11141.1 hypothetical protein RFI_26234 [Reticulomyxa filosa]
MPYFSLVIIKKKINNNKKKKNKNENMKRYNEIVRLITPEELLKKIIMLNRQIAQLQTNQQPEKTGKQNPNNPKIDDQQKKTLEKEIENLQAQVRKWRARATASQAALKDVRSQVDKLVKQQSDVSPPMAAAQQYLNGRQADSAKLVQTQPLSLIHRDSIHSTQSLGEIPALPMSTREASKFFFFIYPPFLILLLSSANEYFSQEEGGGGGNKKKNTQPF